VLVVIVPALLAMAATGIYGLHSQRSSVSELYLKNVRNTDDASDLGTNLSIAHAASLELLLDFGTPPQQPK
jgi:hypothetical protein